MACRRVDLKTAMVRLAALPDGVVIDSHGMLGGRGGYLHLQPRCLELFVRAKVVRFNSLRRALDRSERVNLVNMLAGQLATNAGL